MITESLMQQPLFDGIEKTDLERLINCLNPTIQSYSKNEIIYSAGDTVTRVAMILSGEVRIFSEDYAGNTSVAATLKSGEVFGDICAGIEKSETTARAFTSSQIMFIEYRKITGVCREACEYHIKTLCNLLGIFAAKNRALSEDLQVLQKRTTREKLLAYLYIHAKKADSPRFNIPFNREGLAEYLRIDRSAMSRELCAMRDEGLLEFYKNSFILLGEN